MTQFSKDGAVFSSSELVSVLKAAAEPTRLRILLLLRHGELNVKDLMQILRQSQPRLSRHLKLLFEAGLLERFREGSWVYFRLSEQLRFGRLAQALTDFADVGDPLFGRDAERLQGLKSEREDAAQAYFEAHASEWDRIRSLHVAEKRVEEAMLEALGDGRFDLLIDLGTGTGRTLELFADRYRRAIGFDVNQSMLAYARAKLSQAGVESAQVRQGDIYNLSLDSNDADVVVMHQVMHFLADPAPVLAEAARCLKPGGRLLIVDFAPHEMEFLRDTYAHERLGFSDEQVGEWLRKAGLEPVDTIEMAPQDDSEDRLTVMVWLAVKPALDAPRGAAQGKLASETEVLEEI
jgi:ubiquinone/menaquinone biosynthesis C-methylase UbiE/DNA-binding HxlR family transcriptional regulator